MRKFINSKRKWLLILLVISVVCAVMLVNQEEEVDTQQYEAQMINIPEAYRGEISDTIIKVKTRLVEEGEEYIATFQIENETSSEISLIYDCGKLVHIKTDQENSKEVCLQSNSIKIAAGAVIDEEFRLPVNIVNDERFSMSVIYEFGDDNPIRAEVPLTLKEVY